MEKNAAEVAKDLRPDADTAPAGRAPRHTYYARHLVERHELFHQADFLGAVAPAWQKVQERMDRVQLTRADQAVDVMTKARQVVEGAIWEVYSGAGANSRAKAEAVPFQSRPGRDTGLRRRQARIREAVERHRKTFPVGLTRLGGRRQPRHTNRKMTQPRWLRANVCATCK